MKTSWNFNRLKKNNFKLNREKAKVFTTNFIKKWKNNTKHLSDAKQLKKALDEFSEYTMNFGHGGSEIYYLWLSQYLDLSNPSIKAKLKKAEDYWDKIHNSMIFFELTLSKIPQEKQKVFLESPDLSKYKHYLEKLFAESKYLLSEKEEQIINRIAQYGSRNWEKLLEGLLAGSVKNIYTSLNKKENKNFSEIIGFIDNKNKKVRDSAANALNKIFKENLVIAENEINNVLGQYTTIAEIRGFKKPYEPRFTTDDVSEKDVLALVKAVTKRFDQPRRYYQLKAKILGVKKLKYHERSLSVSKVNLKYTFKDAYDLCNSVFLNIDPSFANIFANMFKNGQVDVYPKNNKRSGAFCAYNTIESPSYMLLNFNEKLSDVTTIAHEFGHAIHFELSKKQNPLNYSFPMSTAETSSTFFEDFVFEEVLKDLKDIEKLGVLMDKLNDEISTIHRQIAFFNFELELHNEYRKQGYLPAGQIGEIFKNHMISYMGDSVEQSEGAENWWVYVSHFRSFFYVYSYAFGQLISKAFQKEFKETTDSSNIKRFLQAGASKSPVQILKECNINIGVQYWNNALNSIDKQLDIVEKLADKI